MILRKAEEKDTDAILGLLKQVLDIHHRGRSDLFRDAQGKYTREQLAEILHNEERPVFVAEEDGCVLGYAFCIHEQILNDNIRTDIKTLYVDDLCVLESARRKGVGKALYAHVRKYAMEKGFYNVTLNVWGFNKEAIAFYESLGMQVQKIGMEEILK